MSTKHGSNTPNVSSEQGAFRTLGPEVTYRTLGGWIWFRWHPPHGDKVVVLVRPEDVRSLLLGFAVGRSAVFNRDSTLGFERHLGGWVAGANRLTHQTIMDHTFRVGPEAFDDFVDVLRSLVYVA